MKTTIKRQMLSIFLAVALFMTMLPTSIFAAFDFSNTDVLISGTDENNIPTLSLQYIEEDTDGSLKTNPDGSYATVSDLSGVAAGTKFYLAIKADNFTQYTHNADKMYVWGAGIAFDPEFIRFEPTYEDLNGFSASDDSADFISRFTGANGVSWYNSRYTCTAFSIKSTDAEADVVSNCNQTLAIMFQANNANFQKAFTNSEYLGFIEFELKKKTDTSGVKVIQFSRAPTDLYIEFGTVNKDNHSRYTYNNADSQLEKYLKLDESGVNFFPATYQVKFYNDYNTDSSSFGTLVKTVSVPEGTSIKTSDIPVSSDFTAPQDKYYEMLKYVTAGDTPDPDNDNEFDPSNPPSITSDIDVYATYVPGHTVTFDSNYPSGVTTPTATTKPVTVSPAAGTTFDTSDEPTVGTSGTEDFAVPTGYSFKEWNTQPDGKGTTIVFGTGGTDISAVNTVYAIWTQNWKIEFQKVEGSVESGNVLDTEYMSPTATDKTVLAPSDPSRTGYKFNGWYYYDGGTKTTFVPKDSATGTPTQISGDTTIYADWIKQVTVKYYDTKTNAQANGTTGLLASETVDENTLYSALTQKPTTTDDDTNHPKQYFEGWYNVTGDTKVDFSSTTEKVTDDLIVYQNWKDFYKLEFYKEASDIGTTVYDTKYVNPKVATTLATLPTEPTKANYGFNEWRVYDSNSSTVTSNKFDTNTPVSDNMVLVANWTAKITITFHKNDGTTPETTEPVQITPDVNFDGNAPTYTRVGYTFKEWNTESNGSGTAYASLTSTKFSASDDLYAIWTAAGADQSTLTFDANLTGVTPNPSSVTVNTGDKVYTANIPVVSKVDYTFDGWYESASITDTTPIDFSTGYAVSESKTVYAHWTYNGTDAVTVKFMNDSTEYATIKVAPNTTLGNLMPANPTKSGYTFKEWNTAAAGTGTTFDKNTNVGTTGPATVTVYAQYVQDITVNYDTNGGNADGPAAVTKPAGDAYEDPTETPTKNGVNGHPNYTFLGWNTEKNGSGTYIKAGNKTGSSDPLKYEDLVTGGATSVTLYAQWGAYNPENGADEKQQAVTVTFDGNGTTQKPVTKEANPKNKYPQLGDSIGTDNMPNDPERTDYTFKEWNTKADGTGTKVTGTTVFDENLDGVTAAGNGTYTSTVYAQWTPATTATTVTVTFNKNTDGKGTDANPITKTIVSGDSLGAAMPADPTNGTYAFDGWYAGSVTDGKVTTSGNKLTSSTPISATTTYYAKWTKMLVARMQTNTAEYTGSQIKPLFDIYEVSYPDAQQPYVLGTKIATGIDPTTDSDYTITYTKDGVTATGVQDVGSYVFDVKLADTSARAIAGATIAVTDYEENNNRTSTFTVTPKLLTVKVDPDTQLQKAGATVPLADVTIVGLAATDQVDNVIEKKYYKWTPKGDSDTAIDSNELAVEATPTAVAKYVLQVTVKSTNKNYKIDSVVSSKDGTPVLLYEKTATQTYPAFNILNTDNNIVPGTNIVYVIQANDPSISNVDVKSADTKDDEGIAKDPEVVNNLSLKQSDYKTDEPFDNAEKPTTKEYYVRVVDVGAEEVRFTITLTNPDTTSLTATGGTAVKNTDGTYTVTAPLTNKGATANVVKITTKAGDAADAPTITYTFNVQQLVTAKIELNYGNSPYGEIMKADNIAEADKQKAKDAFNVNNKFTSTYLPTGCNSTLLYKPLAWAGATDSEHNMDRNDYALFVYEKSDFKDPGFTAVDSLGNSVAATDITRTIDVYRLTSRNLSEDLSQKTPDRIIKTGVAADYTFTEITTSAAYVRPDVYDMVYSFTDPNTGETVTTTRKIVVLLKRGDTNVDNSVNGTDLSPIVNYVKGVDLLNESVAPVTTTNIFKYRVVDMNMDGSINGTDLSPIVNYVKGVDIIPFYNAVQ